MSSQDTWSAVDRYITDLIVQPDDALDAALAASDAAGLPAINVSPNQGKLLHLLARAIGARNILEIGTLGGYSTIWLARGLAPGGRVVTLEYRPEHAEIARKNLARAGVSDAVDIVVGRAIDRLPNLIDRGPFDLTFIDADKQSTADYFSWSLKLSRPGSLIIVDNVVRKGEVINPRSEDTGVQGIRRFNETMARDHRVSATAIQTVGGKGYDGFAIAIVESPAA